MQDNRSIVDDESALTALLSAYDAQHKSDRTPSRTDANGAVDSNSTETSNMPSFDDSSITSDSSFSAASIGKPAVSTIASAELNSSCGAAMPSAPLDCNSQGIDTVMSNDDSSKQLHIRADADGPTGRSRAAANSPSAEGSAGVSGFIKQNKVAASPPTVKARADAVEFAKGSSARPALCQSTMNMRHSDHSSLVSCPRVEVRRNLSFSVCSCWTPVTTGDIEMGLPNLLHTSLRMHSICTLVSGHQHEQHTHVDTLVPAVDFLKCSSGQTLCSCRAGLASHCFPSTAFRPQGTCWEVHLRKQDRAQPTQHGLLDSIPREGAQLSVMYQCIFRARHHRRVWYTALQAFSIHEWSFSAAHEVL